MADQPSDIHKKRKLSIPSTAPTVTPHPRNNSRKMSDQDLFSSRVPVSYTGTGAYPDEEEEEDIKPDMAALRLELELFGPSPPPPKKRSEEYPTVPEIKREPQDVEEAEEHRTELCRQREVTKRAVEREKTRALREREELKRQKILKETEDLEKKYATKLIEKEEAEKQLGTIKEVVQILTKARELLYSLDVHDIDPVQEEAIFCQLRQISAFLHVAEEIRKDPRAHRCRKCKVHNIVNDLQHRSEATRGYPGVCPKKDCNCAACSSVDDSNRYQKSWYANAAAAKWREKQQAKKERERRLPQQPVLL